MEPKKKALVTNIYFSKYKKMIEDIKRVKLINQDVYSSFTHKIILK